MVCKSIQLSSVSPEMYKETFDILSPNRQSRILAMKTDEEKRNAVAFEMLARKCLSALTDAPEFAFNILTGINKLCLVSNFSAYFSLSMNGDFLCCAADKVPIGIDCRKMEPFRFSEAQRLFSDVELRQIFATTVRSLADIVRYDVCDMQAEMLQYWKMYTMKEAYFTALGRTFRNFRDVSFDFSNGTVTCSDARFTYDSSHKSPDGKYVFSIVRKTG